MYVKKRFFIPRAVSRNLEELTSAYQRAYDSLTAMGDDDFYSTKMRVKVLLEGAVDAAKKRCEESRKIKA